MIISEEKIMIIATEFRKGILGRRKSRGMCGAVSWALQGYLSFLGTQTTVHESEVDDWNHIFLKLPNGHVIDATADQFGKKYPKVYIGKPLDIHKKKRRKIP